MRAAVIERPGTLAVREAPDPQPGDYDALCQLLYGATCSGTDHHLLAGRFPWPVRYPTILGHESIGRVLEVGCEVRNLKPGDLVTRVGAPPMGGLSVNWGGFAEYGLARDYAAAREDGLPAQEWQPYRINQALPEGADPRAATMVITWRETLSYISRLGVGPGSHLLVIGSGGNALAFVCHAANLQAVVAVVGSPEREALFKTAGAGLYLDYHTPELTSALKEAQPQGFHFIIDAVGKQGQLDRALPCLRPGGTVGIYGIDDYGRCPIDAQRAPGTFTFYNGGYDEEETHTRVVGLWQQGKLRAGLWLDLEHPFELGEIAAALEAVRERRLVKALVRLNTEG